MATYTDIEGQGKLTTTTLGTGTQTITITPPTGQLGSTYFTLEAIRNADGEYDSTSPVLAGVFGNFNGISTLVSDTHKFSAVVEEGGGYFNYTPNSTIEAGEAYVRGTGGITVLIDADGVAGPLFYYDPATSYSGTGTILTDLSGNNRNALIAGAPAYTSGEGGYFTMVDDYIRTIDLQSLITAVDESHTTEAWIYPTANGVVVSYQGETTPPAGYHFSAIELVSGQVEFGLWNGTDISSTGGTGALTLNAWHQVVLTYDGTTCRGYIDGALAGSVAVNFDSPMDDATPVFMMYFGISDTTSQGDGSYFDGRMGVIRVYNRALTATEIEQNFEADRDIYGI